MKVTINGTDLIMGRKIISIENITSKIVKQEERQLNKFTQKLIFIIAFYPAFMVGLVGLKVTEQIVIIPEATLLLITFIALWIHYRNCVVNLLIIYTNDGNTHTLFAGDVLILKYINRFLNIKNKSTLDIDLKTGDYELVANIFNTRQGNCINDILHND